MNYSPEMKTRLEQLKEQAIRFDKIKKLVDIAIGKIEHLNAENNEHKTTIDNVLKTVETLSTDLDEYKKEMNIESIQEKIMRLFTSVNDCNIKIDINEKNKSKILKDILNELMVLCGILDKNDNELAVEIEMDCSKDEEVANELIRLECINDEQIAKDMFNQLNGINQQQPIQRRHQRRHRNQVNQVNQEVIQPIVNIEQQVQEVQEVNQVIPKRRGRPRKLNNVQPN